MFMLISDRDEHWTGLELDWVRTRLWRILSGLDWIWTVNCFINLGTGLDLD